MRVLPNLEALQFNTNFYKINLVCSNSVIVLLLQYSLNRETFDVKYLSCEDLALVLTVYWQSEAYERSIFRNRKASFRHSQKTVYQYV